MIIFEKVTIQNFKSFGNKPTSINLDKQGSTLILGNNEDIGEKGNSRNGVGKSTCLSAIVFALYGKDLDKLKPDELINLRNGKKMFVELTFSVKGEKFKIIRGRKPNILEFYHGTTSLTRDSMKNTEDAIMEVIDIPYDVFLSVFFLNPFKETFMSMTPATQRNFMESVLSLDTLAMRAEALKAIKKELGVDLKLAQKDLDNAVAMREKEETTYAALIQRQKAFEVERKNTVEELRLVKDESEKLDFSMFIGEAQKIKPNEYAAEITTLRKSKSSLEKEKESILRQLEMVKSHVTKAIDWENNHQQKLDELQSKLDKMPPLDEVRLLKSLDDQIFSLDARALELSGSQSIIMEKDIPALRTQQEALEEEFTVLEGGRCPYCKQSHTDENRMAQIADEFEDIADRMEKLEALHKDLTARHMTLADDMIKLKEERPDIDRSVTEQMVVSLTEKLESLSENTNPFSEPMVITVSEKDTHEIDAQLEEISDKIQELTVANDTYEDSQRAIKEFLDGEIGTWDIDEIKQMQWEVSQVDKQIEEENNKINPYTDQVKEHSEFTDVDSYDKALDELSAKEKHCSYLVKMLTDPKSFIRKNIVDQYIPYLNKKINEYTTYLDLPHVAEISSDMSVSLEYMGKDVSYYTLSRGERLRVDIATAMAFRDLLKMMGKGVNILLVDEVLDSALDQHGTRKTFDFIKQFASNTLLISHREEFQTMVDEVMIVNKRNGFTVIDS